MQNQNIRLVTASPMPKPISQLEINNLISLTETKVFLRKRLQQIELELSAFESELITRIESGAQINSEYLITIRTTERRYPSWKEAFINAAGESEARKVIESTQPTKSKTIIISTK